MTAYDLMLKTNHYLIKGGELTDSHKAKIARLLREGRNAGGRPKTFNDPNWYPKYYIPPYNGGKRLQTVVPTSPRAYIVADNAYEFEILRLLHLFDPNSEVANMIEGTKARLKKTCFGYEGCAYADCFEAGQTVLRFLSFAALDDKRWLSKQINVYKNHVADRRRHSGVKIYYWLTLTDMPEEIAVPEIQHQREIILENISKTYLIKTGSEEILLYVMRNALARLPEFSHIQNHQPYVNAKGRLQIDI